MYIKSLLISSATRGLIRDLKFHRGLNLIVDKTKSQNVTQTGNNVGKTTVLRLIDFCLGNTDASLYQDPENRSEQNQIVKDFLTNEQVLATLVLVDNIDSPTKEVVIKRNFLKRNKRIFTVNGEAVGSSKNELNIILRNNIFPTVRVEKPTFRQLISHNIRYEENRLSNTLKTLGSWGSDEDYETLYLYMFGCKYDKGERRTQILSKKSKEETYKKRLEKFQTKGAYIVALGVIDSEIAKYEQKKQGLNINPDLGIDVKKLNKVKADLNRTIGELTSLSIRKEVIENAEADMLSRRFDENVDQLKTIYQQAKAFIPNLQRTFDELVSYHNQMLINKSKYMTQELPQLNERIQNVQHKVSELRKEESRLQLSITSSDTFSDLEEIIKQLNEFYQKKGAYEAKINSITEAENTINELNNELQAIDNNLFSSDFQEQINAQLAKFNIIFPL